MGDTLIEHDSVSATAVPSTALYGAPPKRAIDNVTIGGYGLRAASVHAISAEMSKIDAARL